MISSGTESHNSSQVHHRTSQFMLHCAEASPLPLATSSFCFRHGHIEALVLHVHVIALASLLFGLSPARKTSPKTDSSESVACTSRSSESVNLDPGGLKSAAGVIGAGSNVVIGAYSGSAAHGLKSKGSAAPNISAAMANDAKDAVDDVEYWAADNAAARSQSGSMTALGDTNFLPKRFEGVR